MIDDERRDSALFRFLAFVVDWSLILLWAGLLFVATVSIAGGIPTSSGGPLVGQAIGFVTMTLPVVLASAWFESSRWQSTPGKRLLKLRVEDATGARLRFATALGRNAAKFAPWELGHFVAHRMMAAGEEGPPLWLLGCSILAMTGPLWWVFALRMQGMTPYDRWSGSRVVAAQS